MTERKIIHLSSISLEDMNRLFRNCVVANGCFDVLHLGHLVLLGELDAVARLYGIHAVVALNSDDSVRSLKGVHRPIVPMESRSALLKTLEWPFTVVVFDEPTPQTLMDKLQPPYVLKGSEYPKESVIRWEGSQVISVDRIKGWSTTNILNRKIL